MRVVWLTLLRQAFDRDVEVRVRLPAEWPHGMPEEWGVACEGPLEYQADADGGVDVTYDFTRASEREWDDVLDWLRASGVPMADARTKLNREGVHRIPAGWRGAPTAYPRHRCIVPSFDPDLRAAITEAQGRRIAATLDTTTRVTAEALKKLERVADTIGRLPPVDPPDYLLMVERLAAGRERLRESRAAARRRFEARTAAWRN